jgi:hypothetical protein
VEHLKLKLRVAGYEDSDAKERAELAMSLEEDLRELNVDEVSHPPVDSPSGAKGSTLEWAQLVVTLAGNLPALTGAVRAWLGRHPGASLTLEIDGDSITLSDPSASERRELIDAWMRRHG